MSNFFTEVLNDLDGLEQKLLGPDYSYSKQTKQKKRFDSLTPSPLTSLG